MAVHYVPQGHSCVSPYLITKGAKQVIDLVVQALGGKELHRSEREDGTVMHAELKIGNSVIMLSEASADLPAMPCMVHVYVPDADAAYARALRAGAEPVREVADQFYGDRSGGVKDAGGNQWWIATHVEDVAPAEMEKRAKAAGKG